MHMTAKPEEPYTLEEHKARHVQLHAMLDELLGDFISNTGKGLTATVGELTKWSSEQRTNPTTSSTQR